MWNAQAKRLVTLAALLSGLVLTPGANAQDKPKVEIMPQLGHAGEVLSVAFSPDGRQVLSGSDDFNMKLWDVASGRELRTFAGHTRPVASVAFSPDGRYALSGSKDATVKLWEIASGREVRQFQHRLQVKSVAFAPDGKHVLVGAADGAVKLWELTSGREARTFSRDDLTGEDSVDAVTFSPDGRYALSGHQDSKIKLWDVASGRALRTFSAYKTPVSSIAVSPDGKYVASGSDWRIRIWETATGREVHTLSGHGADVASVAFSPDGRQLLSGGRYTSQKPAILWDVASGRELRAFQNNSYVSGVAFAPNGQQIIITYEDGFKLFDVASGRNVRTFSGNAASPVSVAYSPDGRHVLSASAPHYKSSFGARGARQLHLWDAASGSGLRSFAGHTHWVTSVAFSPDGRHALSGSRDQTVRLWEIASGREVRSFSGHTDWVHSVAFLPDGRHAISGAGDKLLRLWEVASGREVRTFAGHDLGARSVAVSADGRYVASGGWDRNLKLWDVETGREVRAFPKQEWGIDTVMFTPDGRHLMSGVGHGEQSLKMWELATGREVRTFSQGFVRSVAFSTDGRYMLSGGGGFLKLWDFSSGRELRSFSVQGYGIGSVAFSPDGRHALAAVGDRTFRVWSIETGQELLRRVESENGDWMVMTPTGFFDRGGEGEIPLHLVRGREVLSVEQVYQSLFNPDLLREALAGDRSAEVARGGAVMNLEKVFDSGPAPLVAITTVEGVYRSTDVTTITARVTDQGKGIGRIEWRVNGVVAAVAAKPPGNGPDYTLTQPLALDRGDNTIELVAYNASNLLASTSARTHVKFTAPVDQVEPTLHILAIGINAYVDRGWKPAGQDDTLAFGPLALAAKDATTFGEDLKRAATGIYENVRLTTVLDKEATRNNLNKIINQLAADIHPRDTFILFAAAHGKSEDGRFYLIPQDYDGGPDPTALAERAIDQGQIQDWLANRIKAKKAIILLDTCESGALVGGSSRSRIDARPLEAALGRLHEATGRPILTAAAEGKPAFEGYEGHGVFTWSLLDALRNGDRNRNGAIELSELVAYVQDMVPKISAKLNGRGVAAVASRGSAGEQQSARFGSRGEDFVLTRRLR